MCLVIQKSSWLSLFVAKVFLLNEKYVRGEDDEELITITCDLGIVSGTAGFLLE